MADIVTENKVILDNVLWSNNEPKIYLTLSYDVKKDGDTVLNRGSDSYTFFNLTLTVSMPGKYAYYGYSIYATIVSGEQRSPGVMIKDRQPQYWKQYSYSFGDFSVSAPYNVTSVPIYVLMGTNAPATIANTIVYYEQDDDTVVVGYDYHVTQKGQQFIKEWTKIDQGDNYTALVMAVKKYKSYQQSKINSANYEPADRQHKLNDLDKACNRILVDTEDFRFKYVYVEKVETVIEGEKRETGRKTTYTTEEDRNGMQFGYEDWYIGEALTLPTIEQFSIGVGGTSLSFSVSYKEKFANSIKNSWRWEVDLYCWENNQWNKLATEQSLDSLSTFLGQFYTKTGQESYVIYPNKVYKLSVKFGEDGNWTETLYKIIPERFGFYVGQGGKWHYCWVMIGRNTPNESNLFFDQYKRFGFGDGVSSVSSLHTYKTVQDDGTLESGTEDE